MEPFTFSSGSFSSGSFTGFSLLPSATSSSPTGFSAPKFFSPSLTTSSVTLNNKHDEHKNWHTYAKRSRASIHIKEKLQKELQQGHTKVYEGYTKGTKQKRIGKRKRTTFNTYFDLTNHQNPKKVTRCSRPCFLMPLPNKAPVPSWQHHPMQKGLLETLVASVREILTQIAHQSQFPNSHGQTLLVWAHFCKQTDGWKHKQRRTIQKSQITGCIKMKH